LEIDMNWKTWTPLALAIVLGLVAMKVARDVTVKRGSSPVTESGQTVAVLNKDLTPGSKITAADLTLARVGSEISPEVVFSDVAKLEGRVLLAPGLKGAPVVKSMVADEGTGAGLQAIIPEGMRALTIEINEFSGVAGNLTAGCRVDVVSTLSDKEGGEMMARTVVQNIQVQSIGMRRTNDGEPAPMRSVTLLATPKEAEAIELAYSTGRPRLVLRSSSDEAVAATSGVSVAELRRGNSQGTDPFASQLAMNVKPVTPISTGMEPTTQPIAREQVKAPAIKAREIRIIRGGVESTVTVEEPLQPVMTHWVTDAGSEELITGEAGE
jgi:pilus assembly protein CpaB